MSVLPSSAPRAVAIRAIRRRVLAALVALCGLAPLAQAKAEVFIVPARPAPQPVPIALPDLPGDTASNTELGRQVAAVVTADLARSGQFKPLDAAAFPQDPASLRRDVRFADWKLINAQELVSGGISTQPDGSTRIEFRLWDVFASQQMAGLALVAHGQEWRRVAHVIADEIYQRTTGEPGYFNTQIVYVAEIGPPEHRVKQLALMDQDGAGSRSLTDGQALVLAPRFSPTSQEIAYLSYAQGTPRVFLFNLATGAQATLGDFPGLTATPRFSPDGKRVIFSQTTNHASRIYTMDLPTRQVSQVTTTAAIDTSPCYSPDGQYITFGSDRGGTQQLYVMNADGSDIKRISFGSGRYATPVWSPRGNLIAFTKFESPNFSIGVMKPDGSGERILSNGFLLGGPTWAPNGRVLMYFRQTPSDGRGHGSTRLYSVDLTGANEREVVTPQEASDPAWSPLLAR